MKGAKYKSHYLAMRKWVFSALKEQKQKQGYQKSVEEKPKFAQHSFNEEELDGLFDDLDNVKLV